MCQKAPVLQVKMTQERGFTTAARLQTLITSGVVHFALGLK